MDNFDLKKYLAEGRLFKEENLFEINDEDIKKAAAKALNTSPEEISTSPDNKKELKEDVVSTAVLVAGLTPPALELVGNLANKLRRLNDQEKEELEALNQKIKEKKEELKKEDKKVIGTQSPKELSLEKELKDLKHLKDKKFGTIIGNWAKHAGHSLHKLYISPIKKLIQFIGWTTGNKDLQDKNYQEKLANIIYASIMVSVAGAGILGHMGHLSSMGMGSILEFIAEGFKEGLSIKDVVKGALKFI